MTVADFLRSRGASAGAVELLRLGYLDLRGDGVASYLALAILRDWRVGRGERAELTIAGGTDRLPSAFAAAMGPRIRYDTVVLGVAQDGRGVRVRVRRGAAEETVDADALVCALPPPLLAALDAADWSAAKRAIAAVPMTSVTRVAVQFSARPWTPDGGPLSINTDLPVQWLWRRRQGRRAGAACWKRTPPARRRAASAPWTRRRAVRGRCGT